MKKPIPPKINVFREGCTKPYKQEESQMTEYSKAELKLIKSISPQWGNVVTKTNIAPSSLYKILAERAFIDNATGPDVEALRRVCKALEECKIYRQTPEFDSLCEF